MTGHNHYPWCKCGWCAGGGNGNTGSISKGSATSKSKPAYTEAEKLSAALTLKAHGASSYSRCFVNPNASCPVCGQQVFYYSNGHGSRVFFDELGKPWPKHPCTDNGRLPAPYENIRPTPRPLSEIQVILSAEQKVDQRILPVGLNARRESWKLTVVTEVNFADFCMSVQVEDIENQYHQKHQFFIYCTEPLLSVGDLVSRRKRVFSFLHPSTLENLEVVNGDRLINFEAIERIIDGSIIPQDISEMMPSERRHFRLGHRNKIDVSELSSVLKDFAKKGIIGPRRVSHYLNETGRATADGSSWTPRLAFFLIALTGVPQEKPKRKENAKKQKASKHQWKFNKGSHFRLRKYLFDH